MTTVLSQKGQVVLPVLIRQKLHLEPGDDFEVGIKGDDTITLRRVSSPPNTGLVDLLLVCPSSFRIPEREKDASSPVLL